MKCYKPKINALIMFLNIYHKHFVIKLFSILKYVIKSKKDVINIFKTYKNIF